MNEICIVCPCCGLDLPLEMTPAAGDFAVCVWCASFVIWDRGIDPRAMREEEFAAESKSDRRRALWLQRMLRRFTGAVFSKRSTDIGEPRNGSFS